MAWPSALLQWVYSYPDLILSASAALAPIASSLAMHRVTTKDIRPEQKGMNTYVMLRECEGVNGLIY